MFAEPFQSPPIGALEHPVLNRIGGTPLFYLQKLTAHLPDSVQVAAKAEHLNPGGSVKDRAALRMVWEGMRTGALTEGKTLIDATSGNTGIAYAMIGAALGIPVAVVLPENASPERRLILNAYGARIIPSDAMAGTDGAQEVARELVAADPGMYFYPDQYNNNANWQAHFETTGPEILAQSGGGVTDFVAGLGTTGTFVGVGRRLREYDPEIRCHAVQPETALHGLEGLKHLPTATVPGIFDGALASRTWECGTEEAYHMTRRLAAEEGLLVGASSGANVATALRVAEELGDGLVVTVLCDTGTRYLTDSFWRGTDS